MKDQSDLVAGVMSGHNSGDTVTDKRPEEWTRLLQESRRFGDKAVKSALEKGQSTSILRDNR